MSPGRGVSIGRLHHGPLPDPANALLLVGSSLTLSASIQPG